MERCGTRENASPVKSTSPRCRKLPMHNPRLHFDRHRRLVAIDVFRGISICLMLLTTNLGPTWPAFGASPWNGLRVADCVQPFFLFIVGVSIVISMAKYQKRSKCRGLKSAIIRSFKLFLFGLLTEGSESIGDYDISTIRILGILQRISICYLIGVILELYLPPKFRFDFAVTPTNSTNDLSHILNSKHKEHSEHSHRECSIKCIQSLAIFQMYKSHCIFFVLLLSSCIAIIVGVQTPDRFGEICGYHIMSPVCNPMAFIDERILTVDHMLFPMNGHCSFQRMQQCVAMNTSAVIPKWCNETPFEPFGIPSTITAMLTAIIGMHTGHLMVNFGDDTVRIFHLYALGAIQFVIGICLHFPMSTC